MWRRLVEYFYKDIQCTKTVGRHSDFKKKPKKVIVFKNTDLDKP